VLVLSFIEDVERANTGGSEDATPKKKAAKGPGELALDDEAPTVVIPASAKLNRNQFKYSLWRKSLLLELFAYVEPRMWSQAKRTVDSVQLAKQCMEFAFDVHCIDDAKSDKCVSLQKKDVFESLRHLYKALGSRFNNIEIVDGFVDWQKHGVYKLEDVRTTEGREVRVTDTLTGKVACLPKDALSNFAHTFTMQDVHQNFSWKEALLVLPDGDSFTLSQLFPKVNRKLAKKISEELKAVSPKTPAPADKKSDDSTGSSKGGRQKQQKQQQGNSDIASVAGTALANEAGERGPPAKKQKCSQQAQPSLGTIAGQDAAPPSPSAADLKAAMDLATAAAGLEEPGDDEAEARAEDAAEEEEEE